MTARVDQTSAVFPPRAARRAAVYTTIIAAALVYAWQARAADANQEANWLPKGSLGTALPVLADPTGLRRALWASGIKLQLNAIGEVLGTSGGGLRREARPGSRLELVVDVDLEKALGWKGAVVHANAYRIDGTGLTRDAIGNLMTVSNIEALPSTHLYEAWFEQTLADGRLGLRLGQLAADTEFITSNYAGLFVGSTFGWPTIAAFDLPSGGPAYPLATPGARASVQASDRLKLMLGVFNGDPAGPGADDPQRRDRTGLHFRLKDPPLVIGEAQFNYGDDTAADGLSGMLKIGAWRHFGRFADLRRGTDGIALTSPLGNGQALQHRGNQGVYAVVDQQIYRLGRDPTQGVGLFARVSAAPNDRNLVNLYADAGFKFSGLVPSRPDDTFGFAAGYTRVSNSARGLDIDTNVFQAATSPVRSSEWLFEATYSLQPTAGWTVQPLVQYVARPGGGVLDAGDPSGTRRVRNATIVGLRTTVNY